MADDIDADNSWKKIIIAKTNNEWQTGERVKVEREDTVEADYDPFQDLEPGSSGSAASTESAGKPLPRRKRKGSEITANETENQRAHRLAKMSAYAARRLANESPEERQTRLARMSAYAARRLAQETPEQRAKRLARMSAYAARRLAEETPEQRADRLARMSAYAARRHKMKKLMTLENPFLTLQDSVSVQDLSGPGNS